MIELHVRILKNGGVSFICPHCSQRGRATEYPLSWRLYCKKCPKVTDIHKPVSACQCGACPQVKVQK